MTQIPSFVNSPDKLNRGTIDQKLKAMEEEKKHLEQIQREQVEAKEREIALRELRSKPPTDFFAAYNNPTNIRLGEISFNNPLDGARIKGMHAPKRFITLDEAGHDLASNHPWAGALAFKDGQGDIHIWQPCKAKVLDVPISNISSTENLSSLYRRWQRELPEK